jgi:hemerythrin-like metal-binding protein
MMNIGWSPAFQVGVEGIDSSHEEHLDHLKTLGSLVRSKAPVTVLLAHGETLRASLLHHHQDEERVMAHLGYPDLTDHQALHSFLLEEIGQQFRVIGPGHDPGEMSRALGRIAHLMLDHIIRHDLGILTFMQGRGLTEARLGLLP